MFAIECQALTKLTASLQSYLDRASLTKLQRYWLVRTASLPPFNKRPLPVAIDRPAICGKTSGRDSKITNRTPMGTVTWVRLRPSAIIVRFNLRPRQSLVDSAICRRPLDKLFNFSGVKKRRANSGADRPMMINVRHC